jgi:hypothetical protein
VRAESLAMSCSRPAVYMWTSNNEWVNDNVGEIEDEGAECIGVPGRKSNMPTRWNLLNDHLQRKW